MAVAVALRPTPLTRQRASRLAAVSLAVLLAAPAAAADWNWADDPASRRPEYASSVAACERVRDLQPPASDRADPAQAAGLADCDAEALYYGIGMAADPVRARQCALRNVDSVGADNAFLFAGNDLLLTIYANGVGAERDLELATALACRMRGAIAEVHGRVSHLQAMKDSADPGTGFHFCDDITSGLAMGYCAGHAARLDAQDRRQRLARLTRPWREADRAAFEPLQATATAFATTSADNEVDMSGSGRVAFHVQHEQRTLDAFVALLATLESDSLPIASADERAAADARLNRVYRQLMAPPAPGEEASGGDPDRIGFGTVTRPDIRVAQRAWLAYRDAWVAFAAQRYWKLEDSVATWLTRRRADDLATHLSGRD